MRTGRPPERFIDFIRHVMEPSDGCRLWEGSLDKDGYGRFRLGKAEHRVNVMTCMAWHGPMPELGMVAAHSCGNPRCWAGEHLRWATQRENRLDMNSHGTMPHGEAHHKARLTAEKVRDIRARFAAGGVTKAALAREHGVTPQSVGAVIARETWQHIE